MSLQATRQAAGVCPWRQSRSGAVAMVCWSRGWTCRGHRLLCPQRQPQGGGALPCRVRGESRAVAALTRFFTESATGSSTSARLRISHGVPGTGGRASHGT